MVDDRFLVCDEKDWNTLTENQRAWMVFKTLRGMSDRLDRLERWNRVYSFAGGIIGGFVAVVMYGIIKLA